MCRDRMKKRNGVAIIVCMAFLAIFTALAVAMVSMADNNVQLADNQHSSNQAFAAAQSGLEYGRYLVTMAKTDATWPAPTGDNTVSPAQRTAVWDAICTYVRNHPLSGQTIAAPVGNTLTVPTIQYGAGNANFVLKFYRNASDSNFVNIESKGIDGDASKKITFGMKIQKSADVLKYAIASKGRVWIKGDSTVHGNIYSSWKYQNLSPFNIDQTSTVEGTIGTILKKGTTAGHYDDLYAGNNLMPYDLETLDENGNPTYDNGGNKIISSSDEIQGTYENINYDINYGEKATNMPGMDLADYDTTTYYNATRTANGGGGDIPSPSATQYTGNTDSLGDTCGTKWRYEYFPHNAGSYTTGDGLKVKRYIYKNQAFTNRRLPDNKNALFINCTFNGILYVDNATAANNVRFDDCTFNGPIVTKPSVDTSSGWWQRNCLYFTGTETFQIPQQYQTTILAPNFNVNLGNTNPDIGENNVLTGAIVGGIVDIRGNAEIYGTVISMFDTSGYSSGYVSNIGATTEDGGSETTEEGDIGTINITPNENQMLPSGITTPIDIAVPTQVQYCEM